MSMCFDIKFIRSSRHQVCAPKTLAPLHRAYPLHALPRCLSVSPSLTSSHASKHNPSPKSTDSRPAARPPCVGAVVVAAPG